MNAERSQSPSADSAAARSIKRYIDHAGENALIGATWNHTLPAAILEDRNLNSADIHLYLVLKHCLSMNGHGKPATMPTYSVLCDYIGHRSTISASLTVLRATRWITAMARRGHRGQFAANSYIVHDRPLSAGDVVSFDDYYGRFMAQSVRHPAKRVQRTCARIVEQLASQLAEDDCFLEPETAAQQLATTLHQNSQAHARAQGYGGIPAPRIADSTVDNSVDSRWTNNLVRNPYQVNFVDNLCVSDRVRNPHSVGSDPVRNPYSDESSTFSTTYDPARNPYSVQQRCCLKEKTTTTNRTAHSPQRDRAADYVPKPDPDYHPDYVPDITIAGRGLHDDLTPGEAQYLDFDPLIWPDCIGPKQQQLLRPLLVANLSLEDAQHLLTDLDEKIAQGLASDNPIKNPVGYLRGMLKHGYTPQTASTPPPATVPPPPPVATKPRPKLTEAEKQRGIAHAQATRSALGYGAHRRD